MILAANCNRRIEKSLGLKIFHAKDRWFRHLCGAQRRLVENKHHILVDSTIILGVQISFEGLTKDGDKVIFQHDNARPHVAKVVKETLEALNQDILPHPPYSSDIAPWDYNLFRSMAHGLPEQHFTSYEELKNWVVSLIASKDEEFFQCGIRMLPER